MSIGNFTEVVDKAIEEAIKGRIEQFVKERVEETKKDLDKRVPEIVAGVLVDIMKHADMQMTQDRYVFTLRKSDTPL